MLRPPEVRQSVAAAGLSLATHGMSLPHAVMARVARELRDLHSTPCEGLRVCCPFLAESRLSIARLDPHKPDLPETVALQLLRHGVTVQILPNDDSLLDVLADVDGPGEAPTAVVPTQAGLDESSFACQYLAMPILRRRLVRRNDALPTPAAGTPFEGGVFRMKLVLGQDFPASPPKGTPLLAILLLCNITE